MQGWDGRHEPSVSVAPMPWSLIFTPERQWIGPSTSCSATAAQVKRPDGIAARRSRADSIESPANLGAGAIPVNADLTGATLPARLV